MGEYGSAGSGSFAIGGGGNDSITITTHYMAGSAGGVAQSAGGNTFGTIVGGAGADSITFSGVGVSVGGSAGAIAGVVQFSAVSDSTEASMDVISFHKSAGD